MQMLMLTVSLNVDTLTRRVGFCLSAAASVSILRFSTSSAQVMSPLLLT